MPDIPITPEDDGVRLDRFVRQRLAVPLSLVYRLIRTGGVRVDGARGRPETRLREGQTVRFDVAEGDIAAPRSPTASGAEAGWVRRAILLADDAVIAVSKPAGVVVHTGTGHARGAVDDVRAYLGATVAGSIPGARAATPVHRLDRDTSGVLLFARTAMALRRLAKAIARGELTKEYLALTVGIPTPPAGVIEAALEKVPTPAGDRVVESVGPEAREARTYYEIERVFRAPEGAGATPPDGLALVRVRIETGRTHQIRAHLAHRGWPVAGDFKYGDRAANLLLRRAAGLERMFLHAARLVFPHPVSGKETVLLAPLPPDLAAVLDRLAPHGA